MARLVDLAHRNEDMEEKELYELFTKRMDIGSNVWLLVVGFVVGYVSTFATVVLNLTSAAGTVWTVSPPIALLLATVVVLLIVLFSQVFYYGVYGVNPIHAQEGLLKDYLAARKVIRDRLDDWTSSTVTVFP